jgi:crotonobetainyl-CoA:carnitine CoA-transferase CaiB-like acyl-CoA transferase
MQNDKSQTALETVNRGPLKGVKILDLTTVVMGPYATQILGDMGADIVKVEPPAGDNMRAVGPMKNPGMGHIFLNTNRNKRSLVLDLKQEKGRKAALRLAAKSDVIVYNVRPAAMARLGLSYDDVKAVNPGIIYVGAFGFSEDGPYAGRPAYDDLIQGAAGVAALAQQQSGDVPRYAPVTLGDRSVGLQTAIAVAGALFHRAQTGEGQAVEVTMFESLSQFVLGDHMGGKTFVPPIGATGYARLIAPHRRPYATSDGYLCVLIYNDKQWQRFFQIIGRDDLSQDKRFCDHSSRAANIREVYEFVAEVMKTKPTETWMRLLNEGDIPATPMHTIDSLIEDTHLNAIGFFPEYEHPTEGTIRTTAPVGKWSKTPPSIRALPARLGEHSREVLGELGYGDAEIDAMIVQHVTAVASGS